MLSVRLAAGGGGAPRLRFLGGSGGAGSLSSPPSLASPLLNSWLNISVITGKAALSQAS